MMTTDDELIEKMWLAFNHAPNQNQMRAVLEVMRAHDRDGERYRWLRDKATWYHCYITNTMMLQERFSADVDDLDTAIDAAMRAEG